MKRIHVWKLSNKNVGFLLHPGPNFGVFKNIHFCTFLLILFRTNYCFFSHEVQPFKMVLSIKILVEKDKY